MEDGGMNGVSSNGAMAERPADKGDGGKMNGANGEAQENLRRPRPGAVFELKLEAARRAVNDFARAHLFFSIECSARCRAILSAPLDSDDPSAGRPSYEDRAKELRQAYRALYGPFDLPNILIEAGDFGCEALTQCSLTRTALRQRQVLLELWPGFDSEDEFIPSAEIREAIIARAVILLAVLREIDKERHESYCNDCRRGGDCRSVEERPTDA